MMNKFHVFFKLQRCHNGLAVLCEVAKCDIKEWVQQFYAVNIWYFGEKLRTLRAQK